jgi:hypothetical protein
MGGGGGGGGGGAGVRGEKRPSVSGGDKATCVACACYPSLARRRAFHSMRRGVQGNAVKAPKKNDE